VDIDFKFEINENEVILAINVICYFTDKSLYEIEKIITERKFENDNIILEEIRLLFIFTLLSGIKLNYGDTYFRLRIYENKNLSFKLNSKNRDIKNLITNIFSSETSFIDKEIIEELEFFYQFEDLEKIFNLIKSINAKKPIFQNIYLTELLKTKNYLLDYEKVNIPFSLFIIEDDDKVYLRRFYLYEIMITKMILNNLIIKGNASINPEIEIKIEKYLNGIKGALDEMQLKAIENGLKNIFTLITGGPGTGKTFILSLLIKGFLEVFGYVPEQIITVAPTGKAAKRISETLKDLNVESTTIHRLLGSSEYSLSFKYHKENPINYKVVIIDESSMIDIPLMAKLLDALLPDTRLILTGDANQLSSVEAGRVFADLFDYFYNINFDKKNSKNQQIYSNRLVQLVKSYRYKEDSIVENAKLVLFDILKSNDDAEKEKKIDELIKLLNEKEKIIDLPIDYSLFDKLNEKIGLNSIFEKFKQFSKDYNFDEDKINTIFEINNSLKFLSPLRFTPSGIYNINKIFASYLRKNNLESFLPILITKNNYQLNLFNGDIGLIFSEDEKSYVFFQKQNLKDEKNKNDTNNIGIRKFEFKALTDWEPAYCMTVHKSQGSEFNTIVLFLPENIDNYEFITAELFYTAITRAKQDFYIVSNSKTVTKILKNKTKRSTGLLEKLRVFNKGGTND